VPALGAGCSIGLTAVSGAFTCPSCASDTRERQAPAIAAPRRCSSVASMGILAASRGIRRARSTILGDIARAVAAGLRPSRAHELGVLRVQMHGECRAPSLAEQRHGFTNHRDDLIAAASSVRAARCGRRCLGEARRVWRCTSVVERRYRFAMKSSIDARSARDVQFDLCRLLFLRTAATAASRPSA